MDKFLEMCNLIRRNPVKIEANRLIIDKDIKSLIKGLLIIKKISNNNKKNLSTKKSPDQMTSLVNSQCFNTFPSQTLPSN